MNIEQSPGKENAASPQPLRREGQRAETAVLPCTAVTPSAVSTGGNPVPRRRFQRDTFSNAASTLFGLASSGKMTEQSGAYNARLFLVRAARCPGAREQIRRHPAP